MAGPKLGAKVRALRRRQQLTQVELADRLGISASYLNLIEHNRRPLTAPLLIKLATLFELDLTTFAEDDDQQLGSELTEVFSDPLFDDHPLTNVDIRDLVQASPGAGRAVVALYQAYRTAARPGSPDPAEGLHADRLPSEEVSAFLQRRLNYFPALEALAGRIRVDADLGHDPDDTGRQLARYMTRQHDVEVRVERVERMRGATRRFDRRTRRLQLSEALSRESRAFQLAHVAVSLAEPGLIAAESQDDRFTSAGARALCRVALTNYAAAAIVMPYEAFLEASVVERYDIQLLGHRFGASYEQICHRLTTLHRPGAKGVPFHLVRVDIAGNISKRFSASGIRFARFAGACPRWNVHAAFLTPGRIRVQVSQMPGGEIFFCVAKTARRHQAGWQADHVTHAIGLGCAVEHASALIYSDVVNLDGAPVPVGVTCRLCERMDCAQRAHPPQHHPLRVDEDVRGLSFYAPTTD